MTDNPTQAAPAPWMREAAKRIVDEICSAIGKHFDYPMTLDRERVYQSAAVLISAAAPSEGGDWVRVPREPTEDQLDDLCKLFWPTFIHWRPEHARNMSSYRFADREHMRNFVRSLSAAAPPAPDADPRGGEREAFEAEVKRLNWGWSLQRHTKGVSSFKIGDYVDGWTRAGWHFYQAALRPQPNAGVLTDSARAQAAAETPFATGIHTASREIASDVDTVADEKAPEKIAAIITKHLGAGAGVTLTEEERKQIAAIVEYAFDDYAVAGPQTYRDDMTTLIAIIARLTPVEANHG